VIDARLTAMPLDWLECYGGRRHDFRWRGAVFQRGVFCDCHARTEQVVQVCQRCPKERKYIIDIKRPYITYHIWYSKVDGYDAKPGDGRLDPEDVRKELVVRARAIAAAAGKGEDQA
jgi:hypothetical protein